MVNTLFCILPRLRKSLTQVYTLPYSLSYKKGCFTLCPNKKRVHLVTLRCNSAQGPVFATRALGALGDKTFIFGAYLSPSSNHSVFVISLFPWTRYGQVFILSKQANPFHFLSTHDRILFFFLKKVYFDQKTTSYLMLSNSIKLRIKKDLFSHPRVKCMGRRLRTPHGPF